MRKIRQIATRTAGKRHGPITHVMSPGDIGQMIKPFIFLDYVDAPGGAGPHFGFHPHSGIATLTFALTFDIEHETSSGNVDLLQRGGLEWDCQRGKFERGIAAAARELGAREWCHGKSFTQADIALGTAIGCIGFHFPEFDWRGKYPNLAAFHERMMKRPAFADTVPTD